MLAGHGYVIDDNVVSCAITPNVGDVT